MKNQSLKSKIFSLILVIAVIVVSLGIGKQVKNPIEVLNQPVDKTISSSIINNNGKTQYATIDNDGHRFAILSSSGQIENQITFDADSKYLNSALKSLQFDDKIYILGCIFNESLNEIEGIKICVFDLNCNFINETYFPITNDNGFETIRNFYIKDNNLFYLSSSKNKIFLYKQNVSDNTKQTQLIVSKELQNEVLSVLYDEINDTNIVIDTNGDMYLLNENLFSNAENYCINNTCKIYTSNAANSRDNKLINVAYNDGVSFSYLLKPCNFTLNCKNSKICIADITNNEFACLDTQDSHDNNAIKSLKDSPLTIIASFVFWGCSLLLIVIIPIGIIRWLLRMRAKDYKHYLKIMLGLCILISGIVAMVITFFNISPHIEENYKNQATLNGEMITKSIKLNTENPSGKKIDNQKASEFYRLSNYLDSIIMEKSSHGKAVSYKIYEYNKEANQFKEYVTDKNIFLNMQDSSNTINILQQPENLEAFHSGKNISTTKSTAIYFTFNNYLPIFNNQNNLVAICEIFYSYDSVISEINNYGKDITIIISIIFVALFLILKILKDTKTSIKEYKNQKKKKYAHAEVFLAGTMEFFKNYVVSLDNVLCVLISKNMLAAIGEQNNGVLIGLPIALFGLGSFLSSLIFPILSKKLSIKKVYMLGAILLTATMLLIAYSVLINDFLCYISFKVFFGIAYGIIYVSNHTLPMCVDDENIRFDAVRSISLTDVSAPILSVMVSGYIANIFGDFSIYIVGAGCCVVILILSILFMPDNLHFKNTNSSKKKKLNSKVLFKFFCDPAIIMCAVVCIVSLCAGAYKSYLFPLFTNGLNISNVDISNYFVIASALVFIFSPSLDKITNKFDHWNNVLGYLFILGFIFCLFATNQTVIWAFAAFFLSCIFQKSLNAEWKVLWPRKCKKQNIDPAQLQPVFSAVDSFGLCVRPVILGAFVAFGSAGSCVALGIVCAVTGILFLIFTRKSSIVSLQN